MNRLLPLALLALAAPLAGCIITTDDSTGTAGYDVPAPSPPVAPQVVEIDPDRTLNAAGGEGVGVFTEYRTGGTWRLSWTCDTARTGQACSYAFRLTGSRIAVQSSKGTVGAVYPSATEVRFEATAATDVGEIVLTAEPGARLTVDATVDGLRSSEYLFFVQDGKVNGGYRGELSNPLTFEPKRP